MERNEKGQFITWRKAENKYRISLGIKCSIANKTYGFLLQAWSYNDDLLSDMLDDELEDKFLELLEDFLGYGEDDFWFIYQLGKEPAQEGDWSDELMETWEWRVTRRGLVIEEDKGDLDEL